MIVKEDERSLVVAAKRKRTWKPVYDELITALMLMTQRDAAAKVGLNEMTVSRLMKWPRFKREYRRRRAISVEHADSRLQGLTDTILNVALTALSYIKPHVVEYENHKGQKKRVTVKANPHLAASVAMQLMSMARERATTDELLTRANDVEALVKKKLKQED